MNESVKYNPLISLLSIIIKNVLTNYSYEERGLIANIDRSLAEWILNNKDKIESIEKIIDDELLKFKDEIKML